MTILDSPGLIRALGQRPSSRRPPVRHVTRIEGQRAMCLTALPVRSAASCDREGGVTACAGRLCPAD